MFLMKCFASTIALLLLCGLLGLVRAEVSLADAVNEVKSEVQTLVQQFLYERLQRMKLVAQIKDARNERDELKQRIKHLEAIVEKTNAETKSVLVDTVTRVDGEISSEKSEEDLYQLRSIVRYHADQISSLQMSIQNLSESHTDLMAHFAYLQQVNESRSTLQIKTQHSVTNIGDSIGISVPELEFVQATFPHGILAEENGRVVEDKSDKPTQSNNVRTDALPLYGCQYWEVEVTWRPISNITGTRWRDVYKIGLRQESAPFRYKLGWDPHSWAVSVAYNPQEAAYLCGVGHLGTFMYGGTIVAPQDKFITNRFGFFLHAAEGTLAVVTLPSKEHLHTFTNINSTEPLVLIVGFERPLFERRFSLPFVDPAAVSPPSMEADAKLCAP